MQNTKTQRLIVSALLLAIATVLSIIQIFKLPFGGGITLVSMLPIVIIAYRYGTAWGLFAAFVGSLLQMLTGFDTVSSFFLPGDNQLILWQAIFVLFMDYIVAYTAVGLGGVFRNKIKNPSLALCLGAIFALFLRYIAHIISGAVVFGIWAEWFFTQEGFYSIGSQIMNSFSGTSLSVVYSVFYNGLYMIPEIILTGIVAFIIGKVPQIAQKSN